MLYNNALLSLTSYATPDPFVVSAHGRFYLTYTAGGDRLEIVAADSLLGFYRAKPTVVWRPPPDTPHSADLWAPELHALDGRWYLYYAADDPSIGNSSHRMNVLGGPPADRDPRIGPWQFLGALRGMPEDQFAIDGTLFELHGKRYFVYSGGPPRKPKCLLTQGLFIVRLTTPTSVTGAPVHISRAEETWERTHDENGDHGINEGPEFLSAPSGAWCGIVYSCAASWSWEYKMAVLHFQGGDPLTPGAWRKDTKPLLRSPRKGRGPFGPGHGNFTHFGDETFGVFHATDRNDDGWAHRRARLQRVVFTEHGPFMGRYVGQEVHFDDEFTGAMERAT